MVKLKMEFLKNIFISSLGVVFGVVFGALLQRKFDSRKDTIILYKEALKVVYSYADNFKIRYTKFLDINSPGANIQGIHIVFTEQSTELMQLYRLNKHLYKKDTTNLFDELIKAENKLKSTDIVKKGSSFKHDYTNLNSKIDALISNLIQNTK